MKREKFIKKRRWLISIILTLFLAMVLAMEQAEIVFAKEGKNVTQNWAAAAVFYDTWADETETFHMTEEDFLACKTDLEARLVYAYSACLNGLPDMKEKPWRMRRRRGLTVTIPTSVPWNRNGWVL